MSTKERPPLLARLLVSVFANAEVRDAISDDLADRYQQMVRENAVAARRWYWRQALACLLPTARLRLARPRRHPRIGRRLVVGGILQDLRFAVRTLAKRPGFTGTAVLTLGIGVGATTAIFSVVNGVLLRPLPYPDAERLVNVWQVNHDWFESPNQGLRSWASSFPLSMPVLRD